MNKFYVVTLAMSVIASSFGQSGADVLGNTNNVLNSTFISQTDISTFRQRMVRLLPARPRLLITNREWLALPAKVAADSNLTNYMNRLVERSALLMTCPLPDPDSYQREPGTIRGAVGFAMDAIPTLAMTGFVRNRPDHTARAVEILMKLCEFSDWNPDNGIDHAWGTIAASLGYDWLFTSLTPEQRLYVRQAIVNKGLQVYDQRFTAGTEWWLTSGMNMSAMCNAGAVMGSLAVGETDVELASRVSSASVRSLSNAIGMFGKEGGWIEGPGYSNFATHYYSLSVASLTSALGGTYKLFDAAGVREAATYRFMMGGLSPRTFNYGASEEQNFGVPYSFFYSKRVGKPGLAFAQRQFLNTQRPEPYDILWYDPRGTQADLESLPRSKAFKNVGVAILRGGPWMNNQAIYAGVKGGDNGNHKSHLDLGTFVLDAMNERWASDLGIEPLAQSNVYPKDGIYYRYNTEGQNTIVFNNQNQDWQAKAPIQSFSPAQARPYSLINLNNANPGTVSTWTRGMAIMQDKYALLQDEFNAVGGVPAQWAMHTKASVSVNGRTATLTSNGKTMVAYIVEPASATFTSNVAPSPAGQSNNSMFNRLTINLVGTGAVMRLTVAFVPQRTGAPALNVLRTLPLNKWSSLASLP